MPPLPGEAARRKPGRWGVPLSQLALTAPLMHGSQGGAAVLSGALPPLCKERWVGVSRAGGVACSNPCGIATHLTYFTITFSLFTCRYSLPCRADAICVSHQSQSASEKPMRSSSPSLSQRKSSLSSLPSLMRSRFSTCFESMGSVMLPRIAAARQSPRSMPW